ncbi:VMAP-C domain-containing protein [Streptomyces sp. NPDC001492]
MEDWSAWAEAADRLPLQSWVTVYGEGQMMGGGLVVAPGRVLTCAHVVSAAAGLREAEEKPTDAQLDAVQVEFLVARGRKFGVKIAAWESPRPQEHGQWWEGDLALLDLTEDGPAAEPARFCKASAGATLWTRYGTGMPRSALRLEVSSTAVGGWYEILPGRSDLHVHEGNSGGGLWDRDSGLMAGLVVSGVPGSPRAYAIRTETVERFLERAGIPLLYGPKLLCDGAALCTAREGLAEVLCDVVPRPQWSEWAFQIANDLKHLYHPKDPLRLADVIVAHERGIPLLERQLPGTVPAHARRALDEVVASVAAVRGARLLTPAELQKLCGLLGPDALTELLAAANQGLRLVGFSPREYGDVESLVVGLEELPAGPRMVPPLLQVVEEVAARRGPAGRQLQRWSDWMADLIGVSWEALGQVREIVSRADRRETRPPLIRVRLLRTPSAGRYRYVIRAHTGSGTLIDSWENERTLAPLEELCERIADAVRALASHGRPAPLVEFTLDDEDFDVPVDLWPISIPGYGPRALGIDRPVVLRGVEMAESWSWRDERWRNRDTEGCGPVVLFDEDDVDEHIANGTTVACAVLCCPAGRRPAMLKLCRFLGLPVVLWHRSAHGRHIGRSLQGLIGSTWPHTLPNDVRLQRLSARKDTHVGKHLALIWEEPRGDHTEGWAGRVPSGRGSAA